MNVELTNTNEVKDTKVETTEVRTRKKQKSQGYRKYTYDVLKTVYPKLGLTEHARSSLNRFSKSMAGIISNLARQNLIYTGRNTIFAKDIQAAMFLSVPRELATKADTFATTSIVKFRNSITKRTPDEDSKERQKPMSHSAMSGLIFPVKRTLDIIKVKDLSNGSGLYRGGEEAGIYLAAVLEYLVTMILISTGEVMAELDAHIKNKKVLIKPRYLLLAVDGNDNLRSLFKDNGLIIINAGINPGILKEVLLKKARRVTKVIEKAIEEDKKEEDNSVSEEDTVSEEENSGDEAKTEIVKKKRHFLPGTVTVRNIKKLQKSDDHILSKSPFDSFVRFIMERYKDYTHFSVETLGLIRNYVEYQTINVLRSANDITIANKRLKMKSLDFTFARKIHFTNLPSYEESSVMHVWKIVDEVRTKVSKKLPPTKPEIRRMSLRAGCKYQTLEMNKSVYTFINDLVNQICADSSRIILLNKVMTVRPKDLIQALRARGVHLIY